MQVRKWKSVLYCTAMLANNRKNRSHARRGKPFFAKITGDTSFLQKRNKNRGSFLSCLLSLFFYSLCFSFPSVAIPPKKPWDVSERPRGKANSCSLNMISFLIPSFPSKTDIFFCQKGTASEGKDYKRG